jgi:hypothetical protein
MCPLLLFANVNGEKKESGKKKKKAWILRTASRGNCVCSVLTSGWIHLKLDMWTSQFIVSPVPVYANDDHRNQPVSP